MIDRASIWKTSRKSLIVDSNLLLLLAVGLWNPRAIHTQKRLSKFTVDDFELLRNFISSYESIVTTAHILTEVSNLAGAASGSTREAIFIQLKSLFTTLDERVYPAKALCVEPEFQIFGLTDAAMTVLSSEMVLLTEDGRLANHLQQKGYRALSLNHVRVLREEANNA